jgi:phage/plasmid-associated DNA primase
MKKKYQKQQFVTPEAQYIRVGVDYFKVLYKRDRYGIERKELKRWKKEEIKQDHGQNVLRDLEKFDDFIIEPNNQEHHARLDCFYNLYGEFSHTPKEGEWKWTKILLEHIFGEQYEIGLSYVQILYLLPKQPLPVLVLVSKERQTGKSTFIDWLMTIFGTNMVIISPNDLSREFNGSYSRANIIAIEETLIEKNQVVEKVKALSTQKTINANLKNVNDFQIPFYGKIIMASNNERKFMKVENDEIRNNEIPF